MKTKRNINQEEWNALAKKVFGNENAVDEKSSINELKNVDASELKEIENIANQVDLHYKLKNYNSGKAYKNVKSRIGTTKKRSLSLAKSYSLLKIAAVIILALVIGSVWLFSDNKLLKPESEELALSDFGISTIELPDGSVVTLNHNSKIDFPTEFTSDVREVFIEGEGFFDVVPNPNKPFIIHAGKANIKVLGTSFNVNAYPDNENVEVVVSTGKVQVYTEETDKASSHEVILDPGDKGIYVNASKELLKLQNQDVNYIAWKTRHLIFSDTSLKEVIKQLNKLYGIEIKAVDPALEEMSYSGHFENNSIDFILEVISLTLDIEINEEGDYYLLNKKS
jgi:ferric-dicitrate binding protein FerR (iron transport regulator)